MVTEDGSQSGHHSNSTVLLAQDSPLAEVAAIAEHSDSPLNAAAQFLLRVSNRLDAAGSEIERSRREQPGGKSWNWTAADDSTATATQGPLWSARQLLRDGLSATATAVERLHVEVCALLSARLSLAATSSAISTWHASPEVRRLAAAIASASSEGALPSFDEIEQASSSTAALEAPEDSKQLELAFDGEGTEQGCARLQSIRAELGEVHQQLVEKREVIRQLSMKLRDTAHLEEAVQLELLTDHLEFSPGAQMTELHRWSLLSHTGALATKVSTALENVQRPSDARVLAQAAAHLLKGKEIDWVLTTKQLGMLRNQLLREGSQEVARTVEELQQMTSGVSLWMGNQGQADRERLQAAVTGCAELSQLLDERGHAQLAGQVQALAQVRSFSREKAAQARELARVCLSDCLQGTEMVVPESPLKVVLLHDEQHRPVHSGLSQPFLESSGFMDRARQQLLERIEQHERASPSSALQLQHASERPPEPPREQLCSYTPRDFGAEASDQLEPCSPAGEWVPETPRTSFGDQVAGVIQRLQVEGSDNLTLYQRNAQLRHRMHGLNGRIDEIEHFIRDGVIVKMDSLNQGIDRVSARLVNDIEEREHMEAEMGDMKSRMKAFREKLAQMQQSEGEDEATREDRAAQEAAEAPEGADGAEGTVA